MVPSRPLRVLVLEDNESDYELMKRELRRNGLEAEWTWETGKDGFLAALKGPADIVLIDYSIPGFDGLTALAMVLQELPGLPAIIVSGGIGEEVAIETLKAGATDYVLKHRLGRLTPVILRALHEAEQLRERRAAEQALLASQKRFEALFLSSNEGISLQELVRDEDGRPVDYRLLAVNPTFERITGLSRDRAVGVRMTDLYPSREPPFLDLFATVATTGKPITFETFFDPLDKHLRVSVFSPEAEQFAIIMVDISERKHLEAQLNDRAEELASSNEELRQFAYVASHDLQEPLRMVISYLTLLESRYSDKLDDRGKEYLRFAVDGGARARDLIRDLLEYSRVGSNGRRMRRTDMEAVLDKVCVNLKVQIQDEGAVLTRGPLPTIVADDNNMAALLQNLISNAIKFHGPEAPAVVIACADERDRWVFSVRDNGIGIDQKYQDRIFQIFQRLHTRDEYPGTGIGLAICKKIVERHGGRIWLDSAAGRGSTFYFSIPKRSECPEEQDIAPSEQ